MYTSVDWFFHHSLKKAFGPGYSYVGEEALRLIGGRHVGRPNHSDSITQLCVHHTAGPPGWDGLRLWHFFIVQLGWDTPGYSIVISPGGRVELLVPLSAMAYGAGSRWNRQTLHICCVGNYQVYRPRASMLDALYRVMCLVDDVRFVPWKYHRELKPTLCCGSLLIPHVRKMRGDSYGNARAIGRQRPVRYP